tara:strand:+ start:74 stop:1129 length:1056 start_codon:yes stop_codon:yes gene_type:complete
MDKRLNLVRLIRAATILRHVGVAIGLLSVSTGSVLAEGNSDECLLRALKNAPPETTVAELNSVCEIYASEIAQSDAADSLIMQRLQRERSAESTRSVLIPHRRNYLIPISYNRSPNNQPFVDTLSVLSREDELDHSESTFQVSLKFSLADNLFLEQDELFFGFTAKSFWQVYNNDISSPFRETNYEPEVFWVAPLHWQPFGSDASLLALGFSHQSNGRGGSLSRSWNRLYANFVIEKEDFVFSLKPWWRIPEDEKTDPLDPTGDDNPDIEKFMGHFEFTTLYRSGRHEVGLMLRNNLRTNNKGAVQLDWTFPMWRDVRGYAQYFNGYGESLIDYNARTERFGIGFLLTDLL